MYATASEAARVRCVTGGSQIKRATHEPAEGRAGSSADVNGTPRQRGITKTIMLTDANAAPVSRELKEVFHLA